MVQDAWPDYEIAPYGYETDADYLLLLMPERAGGRIPAVSKATGHIRWINENDDAYSQDQLVGDVPASKP